MKMLSYLVIFTAITVLMIAGGCKPDVIADKVAGTSKYSAKDIQRALNVAEMVKARQGNTKESWVINTQINVLKQPFFPGAVGVEGAVVNFDERDNPVRGITTRAFNRKTGKACEVHDFLKAELLEASIELRAYYQEILSAEDRKTIKTIVIFSDDFRTAVCESLLNMRQDRDYYMGASLTTKTASIYMRQAGGQTLIAEDKVYYSRD